MSELVARYGGTWNWVNMFITPNIAGETNSGIAGQSKILGYKENNKHVARLDYRVYIVGLSRIRLNFIL